MRSLFALGLSILVAFATPAAAASTLAEVLWPKKNENASSAEQPRKGEKTRSKKTAAKAEQGKTRKAKAEQAKPRNEKKVARRKETRKQAAEQTAEVLDLSKGNTGELRSEIRDQKPSLFSGLFGGKQEVSMLPATRALDQALENRQKGKKFRVKSDFEPQSVDFSGGYPRGTIVIDTAARYLYLVESSRSARRYAIAVGREGLEFKGTAKVGDKQEWPRWFPTVDMQKREPKKYGPYKDGMNGGPDNPLGARAIYLHQNGRDTHVRIHGTNQPQTIGTNSSNGCFRMVNEHVMDLYKRVKVGTEVVVM
jgi:lipoprotein-anchoring transpeptidase ErfK/SrfK